MKREYSIHKTLKLLSKQRVSMVLKPGNVWVIEKALPDTELHEENLQTCLMRGWVEVLHDSVPTRKLGTGGSLPKGQIFQSDKPIYRLTDSGWSAIHRSHVTTILSIIVALVGIGFAI